MKKLWMSIACLATIGLLTGCGSSPSALIKSYSNTALNSKSLIIDMAKDDDYDFFGKDLVIFPKNPNPVNVLTESTDMEAEETESESLMNTVIDTEFFKDSANAEDEDIDGASGLLVGIDSLNNIYGKNVYDRVYPASVTKIMTALLTIENTKFQDVVVFTEDMVVNEFDAKLCGFEVGDTLTVEQLFNGLMVYSGNDAANALAIYIAGSIDAFSDMMNRRAKNLGCVDTHFVNPNGLHDNNHYTSAYDLYLIFNECLKHDAFIESIRQRSYTTSYISANGEQMDVVWDTTNQYFMDVYDYPENVSVLGGKTGTTYEAGSCLILYDVDRKNNRYISAVLGAYDANELYAEMNILLNKIQN